MERVLDVIAHRGASFDAPENTLAAVRRAHAAGASSVECDVHRTRDGAVVVLHDGALGRTVAGHERVADLTYAELRARDAGSWFSADFEGEWVPTLAEWVEAVGPDLGMLVEVKQPSAYPGIEQDVADILATCDASRTALRRGRLTVQSFDHTWLQRFKERTPEFPVGALVGGRGRRRGLVGIACWAEQVNPRGRGLGRPVVDRAHDLGLRVHPWTVDDLAAMHRLAAWGVDGIITNVPSRLSGVLERRAS